MRVTNILRLINYASPDLLFVSETNINNLLANVIRFRLKFKNYFCVNTVAQKGGLLLFWNENVALSILSYSLGHVDCFISNQSYSFYFTGFYGNPDRNLQFLSWNLMHKIASTHSDPCAGWLIGGDFIEILYDDDKKGGLPPNLSQLNCFHNTLTDLTLTTIQSSGPKFTWGNKRKGPNRILERLDRYLADPVWINAFPNHRAYNMELL